MLSHSVFFSCSTCYVFGLAILLANCNDSENYFNTARFLSESQNKNKKKIHKSQNCNCDNNQGKGYL